MLGDHQDTVIARAAIRDLGVRAHRAGENAFTYGLLYERDAETARKLQHRARRVWRKASRAKYRNWLAHRIISNKWLIPVPCTRRLTDEGQHMNAPEAVGSGRPVPDASPVT